MFVNVTYSFDLFCQFPSAGEAVSLEALLDFNVYRYEAPSLFTSDEIPDLASSLPTG